MRSTLRILLYVALVSVCITKSLIGEDPKTNLALNREILVFRVKELETGTTRDGRAKAINNHGTIIGELSSEQSKRKAFGGGSYTSVTIFGAIWEGGKLIPLSAESDLVSVAENGIVGGNLAITPFIRFDASRTVNINGPEEPSDKNTEGKKSLRVYKLKSCAGAYVVANSRLSATAGHDHDKGCISVLKGVGYTPWSFVPSPYDSSTLISAINSSGTAVGASFVESGARGNEIWHATVWKNNNEIQDIDIDRSRTSSAVDINAAGLVVGNYGSFDDYEKRAVGRAFRWSPGKNFETLQAYDEKDSTDAIACNDSGEILGVSGSRNVIWNGETIQWIIPIGSDNRVFRGNLELSDINLDKTLVGYSRVASNEGVRPVVLHLLGRDTDKILGLYRIRIDESPVGDHPDFKRLQPDYRISGIRERLFNETLRDDLAIRPDVVMDSAKNRVKQRQRDARLNSFLGESVRNAVEEMEVYGAACEIVLENVQGEGPTTRVLTLAEQIQDLSLKVVQFSAEIQICKARTAYKAMTLAERTEFASGEPFLAAEAMGKNDATASELAERVKMNDADGKAYWLLSQRYRETWQLFSMREALDLAIKYDGCGDDIDYARFLLCRLDYQAGRIDSLAHHLSKIPKDLATEPRIDPEEIALLRKLIDR